MSGSPNHSLLQISGRFRAVDKVARKLNDLYNMRAFCILLIFLLGAGCDSRFGSPDHSSATSYPSNDDLGDVPEDRKWNLEEVLESEEQFCKIVAADPERIWSQIQEIEAEGERHRLATKFFELLAKTDLNLAVESLPSQMSVQEQIDWAGSVAVGAVLNRKLEICTDLINEKLPTTSDSALRMVVPQLFGQGFPLSSIKEFWESIDSGSGKDSQAGTFGAYLAALDPEAAIEWYESLDRKEEKAAALRSIAGQTPDDVVAQLELTGDPQVRNALILALGSRIPSTSDLLDYLQKVPEDLAENLEISYIQKLVSGEGGQMSYDRVEEYRKHATNQKARDQCSLILSNRLFGENPANALDDLNSRGIPERNPEAWQSLLSRWLNVDSHSASSYISEIPKGHLRNRSVETMISYLDKAGNQEEADAWRKYLGRP